MKWEEYEEEKGVKGMSIGRACRNESGLIKAGSHLTYSDDLVTGEGRKKVPT